MIVLSSCKKSPKKHKSNKPVGEIKNLNTTTPGLFENMFDVFKKSK